ncbi:MAG: hypothetical protein QM754_19330 [Tepidisphaeraceae bacterium]
MELLHTFLDAVRAQKLYRLIYNPEVCELGPPCDELRLCQLQTDSIRRLGRPLPEPFIEFLRITDGLTENSVTIYASHSAPYLGETGPNPFLKWDILEENERHRTDVPDRANLIVFGHTDLHIPSYQIREQQYAWMPIIGSKPDEVFDSFDMMMAATLWLCLKQVYRPAPWKLSVPS